MRVRRVLLAEHRVDFRKGMDGLLAEAYRIGAQPYEGDCGCTSRRTGRRSARWSATA
ncbi:MAG: hypothetical protein WBM17_17640 [Anaerolineales bacterium]